MTDLTPELLARLSEEAKTWPLGPHPRDEIAALASSEMLHAVPALVADARKLAQIRAMLAVEDDGIEGPMGPRWILRQIKEVIDADGT